MTFASACLMDSIRCAEDANPSSAKRKRFSVRMMERRIASYAIPTDAIWTVTWTTSVSIALQCMTPTALLHQTVKSAVQRLLLKSGRTLSVTPELLDQLRSVAALDRLPTRWNAIPPRTVRHVPSQMAPLATRPSTRRIESGAWLDLPRTRTVQIRPIVASRLPIMGQPSRKSASHR